MASRFFHGDTSNSESETSSDESIHSELSDNEKDNELQSSTQRPVKPSATKSAFSRFLRDENQSDDDEDGKRAVKSGKEKLMEELKTVVKFLNAGRKANDWISTLAEFEKLMKLLGRVNSYFPVKLPPIFVQCVSELDEQLRLLHDNKETKKLTSADAKAFIAIKQKTQKYVKTIDADVEEWRKTGTVVLEDENDSAVDEMDDDSDEESSDDDVTVKGADRWKKSSAAPVASGDRKDPKKESRDSKALAGKKKLQSGVEAGAVVSETNSSALADDGFTKVGPKLSKVAEITAENFPEKLAEVLEARGKKGTDRAEQTKILEKLLTLSSMPVNDVKILIALIWAQFEYNTSVHTHMNIEVWKEAHLKIERLMTVLHKHRDLNFQEGADDDTILLPQEEDTDADSILSKPLRAVHASIMSFVDRMESEFTKSLQVIETHSPEYLERLRDELTLTKLIKQAEVYFLSLHDTLNACRLKTLRLELLYFKLTEKTTDADLVISDLCAYLYKHAPDRYRTRAVLCHLYHHALNKRFVKARDMMLMSHLQESIHLADLSTQILYNRAISQIGICAFRCGMLKESFVVLNDLMSTMRVKELLAQGVQQQRFQQNPELEKKEKQRLLPYHQHINLELLETIFLVSSMFVEIPAIAADPYEARKRVQSKLFRRLYDFSERLVFHGPPENTRDRIILASKAFLEGDWIRCNSLISSIKVWKLLGDEEGPMVLEMLAEKIQHDSLRTFFLSHGKYFDTISLPQLSVQFYLTPEKVISLISRMIMNEEVQASIDLSRGVVQMCRVDLTRLQQLSLQFCEKASTLVEGNEKMAQWKLHPSALSSTATATGTFHPFQHQKSSTSLPHHLHQPQRNPHRPIMLNEPERSGK